MPTSTIPEYILFTTDDAVLAETDAAFRHGYKGLGLLEIFELRTKQICLAFSMWRWENATLTETEQPLTMEEFRTYHAGLAEMFVKLREVAGVWQFDKAPSLAEWEFFKAAMAQMQGWQAETPSVDEEGSEVMIPNPETIEEFIAKDFSKFVDDIREQHDKHRWNTRADGVPTDMTKEEWLAARKVERHEVKQAKIKKKEL